MNVWRDRLQAWFTPLAQRIPLSPNAITVIALLINVAAAAALAAAAQRPSLFVAGVVLLTIGGLADALDGIAGRPRPERTLGAEATYGEYVARFEQTLAFGASFLVHDPDVLAAHMHPYLCRDLRKDRAACVPILDALARSHTALGSPASSALVLGLAAKDVRARTAAQDALVDRARHGALDGAELGRQAALLLEDDTVIGQRVSSGLAEVARASDAAMLPVLDALRELMAVLPGRRDAASFLELAADLAERTGRKIQLPDEYVQLANGKSLSAAAKAARRLL